MHPDVSDSWTPKVDQTALYFYDCCKNFFWEGTRCNHFCLHPVVPNSVSPRAAFFCLCPCFTAWQHSFLCIALYVCLSVCLSVTHWYSVRTIRLKSWNLHWWIYSPWKKCRKTQLCGDKSASSKVSACTSVSFYWPFCCYHFQGGEHWV